MYITPNKYPQVILDIKKTSLSHSTCKLVIFVSCLDVDALCAAKVLSLLFRKELIQYQLIPVVGYSELKNHYEKLDVEVLNVLVIGCGAMLDLEEFFEITSRRKIYCIDGHRPWNLDNIFGSNNIICLDDGSIDSNLQKEKTSYQFLLDNNESESESEEESANELTDVDSLADEEIIIRSQDSEETVTHKRMQHKEQLNRQNKQRRKEISDCQEIIQSYYNQGYTLSTSNSATVYALIASIGETNLDNLWLSIIGTSSLDLNYPEIYDKLFPMLKDEVKRNQSISADVTISIEKDYQLFLLRHWTLYDSFFYSSHVNSKLNLWTEDGKKKLHKLFAKMGISLTMAQEKWLYMDAKMKRQLPIVFNKYLPMYGLESIVRVGFVKSFGFIGSLSAMECVEALTALLEQGKKIDDNDEVQNENERIQNQIKYKEKQWINNFWSSWDALSKKDLLLQGIEYAKMVQQIIFRTGMSLLERKMIKNLKLYRLCVLNDGAIPDLEIFNNPLMLSKLGAWLIENLTELDFVNGIKALKPLVIASLDANSDSYLVIGVAPKYPRGLNISEKAKLVQQNGNNIATTRLNTFSVAFQHLSNTSGAKIRIDSFNSSVIEIRKDDLSPFLEKLTLSGLI
ncbi:unnamed protein product [Candida verbasci]|uniref:Cell division control protein 45 n=1 Tax=Candida verbasci TaxID=1227364 RepID=A0A9W4X8B9_9ASCO|nr:unnamed protein product [Candida verbasci]